MEITPVKQLLDSLSETFSQHAAIKKVYGEPIETQGKTIIPVARLALGLGGGFGSKNGDNKPAGVRNDGGGLGGGLSLKPIGIIEVTPAYTRFIRFHPWPYIALGTAIGWAISRYTGRSRRQRHAPDW
jgi:uncharacterized spore protein YtfJ